MIKTTKDDIVRALREKGYKTSYRTKQEAQDALDKLQWFNTFPWHEDQQTILNWRTDDGKTESVVQGVFGSGKTTVMMGVFSKLLEAGVSDVVFCAFNVSIRNELRKKLRMTGLKKRPSVRTFDSIIYEVCRHHEMPGLDKPDYEGRRYFVEKLLEKTPDEPVCPNFSHAKLLLVDETQDLDYKSYDVFRALFPNAHTFFFGDIFQCIQKEPRSSLLWRVLQPADYRQICFMQKTPRVPTTILGEIKQALIAHYPEYTTPISNWYSSNPIRDAKIKWLPIQHYNDVFRHLTAFLQDHPPEKCMILTFSSAITVRGNMGDLSRFRQFLLKEGHNVNRNYKSMDHDKLFLSTVNSSKGLERPHVFIALTFPLELAFANFSNDLVVNLISVGLSRCKESVVFCVPVYNDRFSEVLRLYPDCPKPETGAVANKKHADHTDDTIATILHRSHSTTEVIKQGMLSFATRDALRSCAKFSGSAPFPQGERVKWSMRNEEEASFMGILYEVLATSLWAKRWPELDMKQMTEVQKNPMYQHCGQGITKQFQKVAGAFKRPYHCDFDALYDYTQFHILLSQKIRVRVSPERRDEMKAVWQRLRNDVDRIRPHCHDMRPQTNLSRPFMTGIADMICRQDDEEAGPILYELKTCSGSDWKDEAFTQAALYMSMTQKKRGVIRLVNPFRRELAEYNISFFSKERNVLTQVDREMLLWNFNCFLAKFESNPLMPHLPHEIRGMVCAHEGVCLEFLAATKARLVDGDPPRNKVVARFDPQDPIFNKTTTTEDLLQWLKDAVGYKHDAQLHGPNPLQDDPFFKCVLMGVYIRNSYSFR